MTDHIVGLSHDLGFGIAGCLTSAPLGQTKLFS